MVIKFILSTLKILRQLSNILSWIGMDVVGERLQIAFLLQY